MQLTSHFWIYFVGFNDSQTQVLKEQFTQKEDSVTIYWKSGKAA